MKWQSIVAIYILFWVMSAFVVLPFGVRTHDEAGVPRVFLKDIFGNRLEVVEGSHPSVPLE